MQVKGLALDPVTNIPIIILKGSKEAKSLPIWIGIFEANAIVTEMEKLAPARPMTHDLLKNVIGGLGAQVARVVVTDLIDNTFYANIELTLDGKTICIDSRPSDAIAVALRVEAPIYVDEEVLVKAQKMDMSREENELDKLKNWLKNSKPEDFGKYKM